MLVPDLPRGLLAGALVWRDDVHLGVVDHYGVAVQTFPVPAVAHIDKSTTGHLNVKIESLEDFAQGRQVKFEPVEAAIPLEQMWDRIVAVKNARLPFGLLTFGQDWNCESFARYVRAGLPVSNQAEGFKTFLAGAAIVAAVLVIASDRG